MRSVGRRPLFFAALAVLSLLLYEPTPEEFRWVPLFCAALAGFWAVVLALEDLLGPGPGVRRRERAPSARPEPESPFAPPPPPGAGS